MIGRYKIVSQLGRGTMGTVYKALDPVLERTVAIKTLNPDLPEEAVAEMTARFLREARSAGRLNHPNVVTIYDVGVSGGFAYIAMEYLEGQSLRQLLDSGAPLSFDAIIDIVAQIAEGLDYAGRFGIVHRDIKPANIMISPAGLAKLTDFGVAHVPSSSMTRAGSALGSPKYMSPEQMLGQPVDRRVDIYSLGVVLYEMLMRKTPYERPGLTLSSLRDLIVKQPVPRVSEQNPEIPAVFDAILARALAKRPEDRYQRAGQFASYLRQCRSRADAEQSREHFLRELVRQINQATPAFTVELDLIYVGRLPTVTLGDGLVEHQMKKIEDQDIVDKVALTYRMSSARKARISLNKNEAPILQAQLERAQVMYDYREVKNDAGAPPLEAFLIECSIPASATLRGDYAALAVEIQCRNVGVLGPAKYRLSIAEFDDDTVSEFGRLLLGFPSRFAGLRLPA